MMVHKRAPATATETLKMSLLVLQVLMMVVVAKD
jgi:hypothetical protein